jgi:hypothetical protein
MIKEDDIKNKTIEYWENGRDPEIYIKQLLPEEWKFLEKDHRIPTNRAEILVQLVGFSWEPLFISVCAYKPQEIFLILNKWYNKQEGIKRGDEFSRYMTKLEEQNLIEKKPVILPNPYETVEDTTQSVFKFLRKYILQYINEGKRVVIDITGAKKSMVSGAYLFSSYTKCPVSYVNYDDDFFNEEYGMPYGYKCKIEELNNPMELFKLREWSRVEQLYENYVFQGSKKLIDEIKESTKSLLDKNEHNGIELLKDCIEFYETWDDGDYRGALQKFHILNEKKLVITCPTAVEMLGSFWPAKNNLIKETQLIEGEINIISSIYNKDAEVLVYAKDELEKIKRLIKNNEDFRSAFLRAAGLNEFLFRTRIIKLWIKNQFSVEINKECLTLETIKINHSENLSKIEGQLLRASPNFLYPSLRWKENEKGHVIELDIKDINLKVKAHRSISAPFLNKFWEKLEKQTSKDFSLPHDIFTLRNKAIHFCISVPEDIANVTVEFTEENLKDFQNNWTENPIFNGKYEAMNWYKLCDACGIKFLPKVRKT